ncbi:histone-lysine N-methyltransferase, H3 lysine-9 specific SUVH1-like [Cynara cardunculus var. scolymus]|uniref:Histone H3-K9 methyltransferase, plant n=1 Tax=Cynara cardunculus var. scolymus TaxID=59895 RepID=A0A124SFI6_CYNCS|nr:histone-lysine N-methyltransferase, H3 lysine-9 specific SUVH1-like [Cynara cardunculus var. scolymus]KVI03358.1 histone H3-K9 methyltransferase, plant [Cynara cardunculus var. scolymus]
MEDNLGSDSVPSGPIDKSRVLNVKPLRCLVPIFPSGSSATPQSSPFAFVSPTGSFPPGVGHFYPFATNESQRQANGPNHGRSYPIPSPVPLNSFRTPASAATNGGKGTSKRSSKNHGSYNDEYIQNDGFENGFIVDMGDSSDAIRQKRKIRKSMRGTQAVAVSSSEVDIDPLVNHLLRSFNLVDIDPSRQAESDNDLVQRVVIVYNLLRRKIIQLDDSKGVIPGISRRADLRSGTILMNKGARANTKRRVGAVSGVNVGDVFFFRMELCLVGLHAPIMAGIDYLSFKVSGDEEPIAVSIVSSGGYEDDGDDGEVLVYSGQGGVQRSDKLLMDQKLERGNLALEKSLHRANEVRVVRGLKDVASATGKVYVYDGVYKIHESWIEKGKSGCNVFKYKLIRVSGQPEGFTLWKSIQQWRDGVTTRVGVILPDLTSGAENVPICLVNDVDDEKGPAYFTYSPSLKYSKPYSSSKSSLNCRCSNGCQPATNCPCIERNGGYLPYSTAGVLLSHNLLVHECGSSCLCPPSCRNRVSQVGLKLHLEVFKTKDKGWGLRSWDPIRAGAFICEYAGEVVENGNDSDDNYIFDATRSFEPLEPVPTDEPVKLPFSLIVSAKNKGNVGRFMNHSCSPNVYWQPILRENNRESYLNVGFYAFKHIPPMQELTFNYGIPRDQKPGPRRNKCLCGSTKCKGYFY